MKEIKLLMEHIEEELDDACTYIGLALEYKSTDPALGSLFYKLSIEEMTHMEALHAAVVKRIDTYKQTKGEPPEAMKAVYEYLHKRDIAKAEKVETLQNLYKK